MMTTRRGSWPTRPFAVGVAVGVFGTVLWLLEAVKRNTDREHRAWATRWPRPDGTVRSFGEVWDHQSVEPRG